MRLSVMNYSTDFRFVHYALVVHVPQKACGLVKRSKFESSACLMSWYGRRLEKISSRRQLVNFRQMQQAGKGKDNRPQRGQTRDLDLRTRLGPFQICSKISRHPHTDSGAPRR